ncbi:MPT63 family protein [Mycobacterium sp. MUNTM1]
MASAVSVIAAVSLGLANQPTASADQATEAAASHQLGSQTTLTNGNVVQGWTVSSLQPSKDTIPYAVQGTLWEATATDEAIQGSVIPIVSNFSARSASGETYPVLYQVATPQGVNPASLAQGQKTNGKLYFDITGDKPTSVVYTDGNAASATWTQPTGGPASGGGGSRVQAVTSPAPAVTTPKPGATVTPAAVGSQGTPLPAGSQGTPLPAGSQGTPLPADNPNAPATPPVAGGDTAENPAAPPANPAPGAPAPASPAPGAPAPANPAPGAPAPANPAPGAPAPASPAPAAGGPVNAPAAPAPAGPAPAPAANGSVGTPAGSPAAPAPGNGTPTP